MYSHQLNLIKKGASVRHQWDFSNYCQLYDYDSKQGILKRRWMFNWCWINKGYQNCRQYKQECRQAPKLLQKFFKGSSTLEILPWTSNILSLSGESLITPGRWLLCLIIFNLQYAPVCEKHVQTPGWWVSQAFLVSDPTNLHQNVHDHIKSAAPNWLWRNLTYFLDIFSSFLLQTFQPCLYIKWSLQGLKGNTTSYSTCTPVLSLYTLQQVQDTPLSNIPLLIWVKSSEKQPFNHFFFCLYDPSGVCYGC